jgi:hypothetical protein
MAQSRLKLTERSSKNKKPTAVNIFTLDCFQNGIEFGRSKLQPGEDPRKHFSLNIPDFTKKLAPRSRHIPKGEQVFSELEKKLHLLYYHGQLENSCIYLGVQTDPFYPFEGKFDTSIKLLKLLEKYRPGKIVIQTRSPLIVIAIGSLKTLADRLTVNMVLETCLDNVSARYTPEFPLASERIKAITALNRFNIPVDIQVAPLLPYGKIIEDAPRFADILMRYAEHIYIEPLFAEGYNDAGQKNISDLIAGAIANNHGTEWLRPDSSQYLLKALSKVPDKLAAPDFSDLCSKQLAMF